MDAKDFQITSSRAVHMIGKYVGVCLPNVKKEFRKTIDGVQYVGKATVPNMAARPYIDFVYLRTDASGEVYEDDDNPASGGMDMVTAETVARELKEAVAYISGQQ